MRLRPLTEAECYARCYGRHEETVSVVRREPAGEGARPDAGVRHDRGEPGEASEAA